MIKRLVILAIIGVLLLGYFRNWYSISSTEDKGSAKIGVSIDKDKVRDDTAEARRQARELRDTTARRVDETVH